MGSIVTGFLSADAASHAADTQAGYIKTAQADIQKNMDPAVVNAQALAADQLRATNQISLQEQIDPSLAAQRVQSQKMLSTQLGGIGTSASDTLSAQAAAEAAAAGPGEQASSAALTGQANQLLKAGATLPADVQASLMQSGLEQAGQATGSASARGAGGTILQQVLGMGGLQLQQQRQQQAASLMTTASGLDAQRSQILQGLFPRLQQQQMGNIGATSNILQQSNSMLPQAGLSGADVANVWLQRVGAQNQLTQQLGSVVSKGQLAAGQATAGAWGGVANLAGSAAMGAI
jgi:hypothetical protein